MTSINVLASSTNLSIEVWCSLVASKHSTMYLRSLGYGSLSLIRNARLFSSSERDARYSPSLDINIYGTNCIHLFQHNKYSIGITLHFKLPTHAYTLFYTVYHNWSIDTRKICYFFVYCMFIL